MNTVDKLAARYVREKRASYQVFAVIGSRGAVELRVYDWMKTFGWQDFKNTGDQVMKELKKSSWKLVKAIKAGSGIDYEAGRDGISMKPVYLSFSVLPMGNGADYATLSAAVKAVGLKESRGQIY